MLPEPTIEELIAAGASAIKARHTTRADVRRGSIHEHHLGPAAILWSRESQRDTDLFAATTFDGADGDDLTRLVLWRDGIERILDTYGMGTAYFTRASSGGGAGTIWAGTRILATNGNDEPMFYEVLKNTPVELNTTVAVPIRASTLGSGQATQTTVSRLDDPLWDNSWTIPNLICADGTDFEPAEVFKARVRTQRRLLRVGYTDRMIRACQDVGADKVVLFSSEHSTGDFGLNVCYVGDNGYTGTSDLIQRCTFALESARVLGDSLQVLPMQPGLLTFDLTIVLWDAPGKFNTDAIARAARAQILGLLSPTAGGYSYDLREIEGIVREGSDAIQSVVFNAPVASVTVESGTPKNYPSTLIRFFLSENNITVGFTGPQ